MPLDRQGMLDKYSDVKVLRRALLECALSVRQLSTTGGTSRSEGLQESERERERPLCLPSYAEMLRYDKQDKRDL